MSLASPALLRCATWKKKTPGALFLRKLLHKFLPVDEKVNVARYGKLYHGHEDRCLTAVESKTRDYIESGRMLRSKAKRIVEQLDGSTPFRTRLEYIESLAALACVFPEDMSRKVTGANQKISHILWCSCAPERLEWLWNNIRWRHMIRVDLSFRTALKS